MCAYQYKTSESDIGKIEDTNYKSLHEMILKKKSALSSAFEAADTSNLVTCLTAFKIINFLDFRLWIE